MNSLVSIAQNAFIKKRCIHDNFIYVQRVIQLLHKRKKPALFIKLDISKAFDSIGWSFLLEVMEALGFSNKWRDWIATLLGTASSKVLVNGQPTQEILHARGLRQGDPLSRYYSSWQLIHCSALSKWRLRKAYSNRYSQSRQTFVAPSMPMTRPFFRTHRSRSSAGYTKY